MYIGCDVENRNDIIKNQFRGYLGDIIILNTKNIKDRNGLEIEKNLLNLGRNYSEILSIFTQTKNIFFTIIIWKILQI